MLGIVVLLLFLGPLVFFTLTLSKKLVLYILLIGGIPLTTFMPNLVLFDFLGGLSPQAAMLFFIVGSLVFVIVATKRILLRELIRFNVYTLFLVYVFFSLFWCDNFIYGLRFFVKLMSPFLFYIVVVSAISKKNDFLNVEKVLFTCIIIVVFLTIINYVSGGAIGGDKVKTKWIPAGVLTAPYMSPANFSFFISSMAVFFIGNFFYNKKIKYLIAYILLSIIVFFAFTRISMAGLVFATGLCMIILTKNKFFKYIVPMVVMIGFVVMLFTVSMFKDRMFHNADKFDLTEMIENPETLEKSINTSGRLYLWTNVLDQFKKANIVIGSGVGSVDSLLAKKYDSLKLHSEYLRLYLDFGIVGLLLYIFGMIQMILVLLKISKKTNSQLYSAIAVSSVAFYLVTLFTDNSLNYVTEFGNYVYAFIGLAISSSIHFSDKTNEGFNYRATNALNSIKPYRDRL